MRPLLTGFASTCGSGVGGWVAPHTGACSSYAATADPKATRARTALAIRPRRAMFARALLVAD